MSASAESGQRFVLRALDIPEVIEVTSTVHGDERGTFRELYRAGPFAELLRGEASFVQDSTSRSVADVLRGFHYQLEPPQGKLVACVYGEVYDVAVDLRRSSPTFGEWVGIVLSADRGNQMWVPPGFGHAFVATSPEAVIQYKFTQEHNDQSYRRLAWNDPELAVDWPVTEPLLSAADASAPVLADADLFA